MTAAGLAFAKFSFLDPPALIALGGLAGTLLIAAIIFAILERWRKRQLNETFTTHDQLASFQVLYERGELSHDEYQRIRQQLLVRLKETAEPGLALRDKPREEPPIADAPGAPEST